MELEPPVRLILVMENNEKTDEVKAMEIARLMEDGKGLDVTVLDVMGLNSWADYFVIVTVTSSAHWQGLYRTVKEYIGENGMEIHKTVRKDVHGDDWNLIDLGSVVVHLMSKEARDFYELEKLWHAGKVLKGNGSAQ